MQRRNREEINKKGSKLSLVIERIYDVLWIVFGGIEMSLGCLFFGGATCLMILPIFFGIPEIYFGFMGSVFDPIRKDIHLDVKSVLFKNIAYWILGGFLAIALVYLWGVILCASVIFLPLGLRQFKIARYFLAPFGVTIYKDGEEIILDNNVSAIKQEQEKEEARERLMQVKKEELLRTSSSLKSKKVIDDLDKLDLLLKKNAITKEEYDKTKKEILNQD